MFSHLTHRHQNDIFQVIWIEPGVITICIMMRVCRNFRDWVLTLERGPLVVCVVVMATI